MSMDWCVKRYCSFSDNRAAYLAEYKNDGNFVFFYLAACVLLLIYLMSPVEKTSDGVPKIDTLSSCTYLQDFDRGEVYRCTIDDKECIYYRADYFKSGIALTCDFEE